MDSCYNTGTIQGYDIIGGIVGDVIDNKREEKKTTVKNCYNIGNVICYNRFSGAIAGANGTSRDWRGGIVENCYYLQGTDSKGIGMEYDIIKSETFVKTKEEMKTIHSLLGTEFISDNNNINNGYPILKWQLGK